MDKLTTEVVNGTNDSTVSKHTSAADAQQEADRLNGYHNTGHFKTRPIKEGEKLSNEKKDPSLNVANGDGTQAQTFNPGKVDNELAQKVTPEGVIDKPKANVVEKK